MGETDPAAKPSFAAGLWKRSGLTGKGAIDHGD